MRSIKPAARAETPFTWSVSCGMPAFAALAGVRYDLLFRDADAIIEAYRKGKPLAEELFGPDAAMGGPCWAGISYGHINTLGAELTFPEDSEVAHTPIYARLEEGIRALKIECDFTRAGLFPFYLDLWEKLKKAFPDRKIDFSGFIAEGPVTTAWALYGHEFFADILEKPELTRDYLGLVTASVIRYRKLIRSINGQPEFDGSMIRLYDDIAAMISPKCWPETVLPYLERFFAEQTNGLRFAHIEGLTMDHLGYLDGLRLDRYDPSVSPKLTPALIHKHCEVPFGWRLNNTHYPELSPSGVKRWVFRAAAEGPYRVFTHISRDMCIEETAEKVRAFVSAAKDVERLLCDGCPREELRERCAQEPLVMDGIVNPAAQKRRE